MKFQNFISINFERTHRPTDKPKARCPKLLHKDTHVLIYIGPDK